MPTIRLEGSKTRSRNHGGSLFSNPKREDSNLVQVDAERRRSRHVSKILRM